MVRCRGKPRHTECRMAELALQQDMRFDFRLTSKQNLTIRHVQAEHILRRTADCLKAGPIIAVGPSLPGIELVSDHLAQIRQRPAGCAVRCRAVVFVVDCVEKKPVLAATGADTFLRRSRRRARCAARLPERGRNEILEGRRKSAHGKGAFGCVQFSVWFRKIMRSTARGLPERSFLLLVRPPHGRAGAGCRTRYRPFAGSVRV